MRGCTTPVTGWKGIIFFALHYTILNFYIMPAQIATTDDLRELKIELLESIKQLLKEQNGQITKKWLKSPEVRKLLGISHGTLQTFRINGTIPFTKVGGILYYDSQEIQRVMMEGKIQNIL